MERICPNCKIQLGSYDRYFCTSCGYELPKEMINTKDVFRRVANFGALANEQKKLLDSVKNNLEIKKFVDPKKLLVSITSIILIVLGFLYLKPPIEEYIAASKSEKSASLNTVIPSINPSTNTLKNILDWKSGKFATDSMLAYVPFDADIVIEGFDLSSFSNTYQNFDPAYARLVTYASGNVDEHFIFFAQKVQDKYHWTLIFKPLDKNFVLTDEIINTYPWISFWKNDPIAVLTTHSTIANNVNEAKSNIATNFTHSTLFSSSKTSIPEELKLVIFIKDSAAHDYLRTVLSLDNLPDEILAIIEQITTSKSNYTVVL